MLAIAIEELIADGHVDAMNYTPRQIAAFQVLAERRRRHEHAARIRAIRAAMHGDEKQLKETLHNLERD